MFRWSIGNQSNIAVCFILFRQTPRDLRRSPSPATVTFSDVEQLPRKSIDSGQLTYSRKGSFCVDSNDPVVTSSTTTLAPATGSIRGSGNHLHVPSVDGTSDAENCDQLMILPNHMRVRRHRSLPSPTFNTEKQSASNFPHQQRSSSFRLPVNRNCLCQHTRLIRFCCFSLFVRVIGPLLNKMVGGELK